MDRSLKCPHAVVLGTVRKGKGYNKEVLYQGLDDVLRKYNASGIRISRMHANNEFRSVLNDLVDNWDADINFANPGDHVPDIERENRTIQERFRVKIHRLPFEVIPRTMIPYLVLRITKNRSLFPKKTEISKHFSPYLIMKGRVIDFNK